MSPRAARGMWIATAAVGGTGLGLLIADGRGVETVLAVAFGVLVLALVRTVVPTEHRSTVARLALFAYALRLLAAVMLHAGAFATGDGFITGDDREYYQLSRAFAQFLHGTPDESHLPPYWGGKAYLFGTWVYLESALFYVFGPLALVPILLNAALGAATAVLLYDTGRHLFGHRAGVFAGTLVAVYPSLVLWSALNLKDALTALLVAVFLWVVVLFHERPRIWTLLAAISLLYLLSSLRGYIFTGLTLILPIAVVAVPNVTLAHRAALTAAAATISAVLLLVHQAGLGLAPTLLATSEQVREGLAANARTAFTEAPPLRVELGTTYVVQIPGAVPPEHPVQVVVAPALARIVVVTPGPARPPTTSGAQGEPTVYVRPGDVIVIGAPGATAAPPEERLTLRLDPGERGIRIARSSVDPAEQTARTLAHLPKGMLYALFAPWPWLGDRALDLLTVPEMLVWYAALLASMVTLWRERRRWQLLVAPALYVAGLLLIFALVEGNWGTLFRHRSMVIPFVLLLAAPTLDRWARGDLAGVGASARSRVRALWRGSGWRRWSREPEA